MTKISKNNLERVFTKEWTKKGDKKYDELGLSCWAPNP